MSPQDSETQDSEVDGYEQYTLAGTMMTVFSLLLLMRRTDQILLVNHIVISQFYSHINIEAH